MLRLSKLYGMDIYTNDGEFLGKVHDVILNLEKGEIVRITTEPLKNINRDEAKQILRDKSILYKNVVSAKDILITSKRGSMLAPREVEDMQADKKPAESSKVKASSLLRYRA